MDPEPEEQGHPPLLFSDTYLVSPQQNKLFASEVLSILCQSSEANQRRVGANEGMDRLLQLIAPWKKKAS